MSEQDPAPPNGLIPPPEPAAPEPPRKSLREVAEDAYDEVIEGSDDEPAEPAAGQDGRARDKFGRFLPADQVAKPGEAEAETPPSPDTEQTKPPAEHPAPTPGEAAQPPANWSAEDKALFAKQTPEAQQFLLRRHSEMEGDYQRRVGQTAQATQFTNALAPMFNDPVIAGALRENNLSPFEAIRELLTMQKRAYSPDMRDRVVLWHELGARMGLDPAAVYGQQSPQGQQPPPGLTPKDMQDPAIKFFADHVSRTTQEVQALRGQLLNMQRASVEQANAEAMKVTRWGIDSFAEERGPDGKPLRPDFDTVLPHIIELFTADPNRDLPSAYEQARWLHPQTRQKLVEAERARALATVSNGRARQAVRVNARGVTSPVGKPPEAPGSRSLRDTLEQAADEIGYG